MPASAHAHRSLARASAAFVAIGLAVYLALFWAAEGLLNARGESNPLFKVAIDERPRHDWVILGASHAMPLGFGGFGERMQRETGLSLANLATTGAGPLYNRFVYEEYLRAHRAANILYVADSFAFFSPAWNEERFADAKLLARTPWSAPTLAHLGRYVADDGVGWRAALDYATGFSKINNRDRFAPDRWEGEGQFERVWRTSPSAVRKRIEYLYPNDADPRQLERHLAQFGALLGLAQAAGARVVVVKLPLPAAYASQLPAEAATLARIEQVAVAHGAQWLDLSPAFDDARFFFDSDHLNREGVQRLYDERLRTLLAGASASGMPP